jgi:hypothetical protein
LVDSLTAPTHSWNFRYVSGISDANKWLFVGGSSKESRFDGTTALASGAMTDLGGPTITIPRAGVYRVEYGASAVNQAVGAGNFTTHVCQNGAQIWVGAMGFMNVGATGYFATVVNAFTPTLAANDVLGLRYSISNAVSCNITTRWIRVTPVRVA